MTNLQSLLFPIAGCDWRLAWIARAYTAFDLRAGMV